MILVIGVPAILVVAGREAKTFAFPTLAQDNAKYRSSKKDLQRCSRSKADRCEAQPM